MDITSLTAVELGKKIKAKEISVVDAVKASIEQIEKVEKDVHSFVTIDREGALIFQLALLLSLLALEDLFFGQIDMGYTSLKFLNTSRITDILGSRLVSSQLQVP